MMDGHQACSRRVGLVRGGVEAHERMNACQGRRWGGHGVVPIGITRARDVVGVAPQ